MRSDGMNWSYTFSFSECQNCHARINCDKCAEKLKSSLMRHQDVVQIEINMTGKKILIDTKTDNEDFVLDLLESYGLFTD